ncbi:PGF-CTERM sorting domain-containing protein [Halococcoides cellulosivorans]|uniref:Uncharacterized protein n=1 Tax=Halococcoides cellulosivorans TaxID=1679096 RepID=A0A2R4X360_9EURY|nr:PGF-CTERM sorting domain-containing protein [Halococcoides cellulosivorans]AWB28227.1 hypothetical protein HARCEL1_11190 [Halococcoides cellulosivorans]
MSSVTGADAAVQPDLAVDTTVSGQEVTISVDYTNASAINIKEVPNTWTVVDSSDGLAEKSPEGESYRNVGWVWMDSQTGTETVTLEVPEGESGPFSLPVEAENIDGGTVSETAEFSLDESTDTETTDSAGDTAPGLTVQGDAVAPGETATVSVTAENVGLLSLDGIPTDWTIESYDTAGGSPIEETTDGTDEIAWAWDQNQDSVTVVVALAVPADAAIGETALTAEAANDAEGTTTAPIGIDVIEEEETVHTHQSGETTDTPDVTDEPTDSTGDDPTETVTPTDEPAVSLEGAVVAPGETATVTVTAENVGLLSLDGIPTDWTIESYDAAGGSPVVETTDGTDKIAWTWDQNQDSVAIDVALSVPADAAIGETALTAEAANDNELIASHTASVLVSEGVPTDETPTDEPTTEETPGDEPTTEVGDEPTEQTPSDNPTTVSPGSPALSVGSGVVAPGESVTVSLVAENVGLLSLDGIPTDWTIESYDAAGGSPIVEPTDGTDKIAWTWDQNQDRVEIGVTLSVPADAALGETALTVEAANDNDISVTDTATVSVTDETSTDEPTPVPGSPSVNVEGGAVMPGETTTVSLTAENVGLLSLDGIPTDWTIESIDDAGGSPIDETTDGTDKIAWTWDQNQDSVAIDVTLSVPADAALGETALTAEAANGADLSATDTATVSVTDEEVPTQETPEEAVLSIEPVETEDGYAASLVLSEAPNGISGYEVTLASDNTDVLQVAGSDRVSPVTWGDAFDTINTVNRADDGSAITLKATNSEDMHEPVTDIELATIDLDAMGEGYAELDVGVHDIQDGGGYTIPVTTESEVLAVGGAPETTDPGTDEPSETTVTPVDNPGSSEDPAVSVTGGTVRPGETVTVDITADNVDALWLGGIPNSWTVESVDDQGTTPIVQSYDHGQQIAWNWGSTVTDVSVSATVAIPENATIGDTTLNATGNLAGLPQTSDTATVSVVDEVPTDEPTTDETPEPAVLSIEPVETEDGYAASLVLSEAPNGVSGYEVTLASDNASVLQVAGGDRVSPVTWSDAFDTINTYSRADDGSAITIEATDPNEMVQDGAEDIELATIEMDAMSEGYAGLSVGVHELQDDTGADIPVTTASEVVAVGGAPETTDPGTDEPSETTITPVDEPGSGDDPTVDATDGTVRPGETVTVDITADNVDSLWLGDIPNNWTIESVDDQGTTPIIQTFDSGQEIAWNWGGTVSDVSISVTFAIPENASIGDTTLTLGANGLDSVDTSTISVVEELPTDEPTTEPGTDEPGTDEPGTDEPGTDEPGTDEPGTDEPGTDEPGTDEPGTDEPGTDEPGTDEPGTDEPGTDEPGTDEPGTDEPGTDEPGTDEPGTDEPGTDEPGTDEPGTDEPGTDEPGTDEPGTDEPGTDEPSDALSVSVANASVAPGENATLTLTAENAGMLSLDDIPANWTIESVEAGGATSIDETVNDSQELAWTWDQNQDSLSLNVTLGVPANASTGAVTLTATAWSSDDSSVTDTATVSVTESASETPTETDTQDDEGDSGGNGGGVGGGGKKEIPTDDDSGSDDGDTEPIDPIDPDTESDDDSGGAAEPSTDDAASTATTTGEAVDPQTESQTDAGGPGFGPLVALIALVAATLVAVRRD